MFYNNNTNGKVFSAVLRSSLTIRYGFSLGCNGGVGFNVWKLASDILNKQQHTSEMGCLPGWCLGELVTTQQLYSLLGYAVFHKETDWDRSLERCKD